MPKREDIKSILLIGAGPIIIGQACEFDYSGSQACKALREEGFRVILINSNPATIMTDPEMADRTYIEPIDPDIIELIIEKERPDCLLPTLGGQTALNAAIALAERGVLEKYGVEMIGANPTAIRKAEDRSLFKKAMQEIGAPLPESGFAYSVDEAMEIVKHTRYPAIIRPSFTMGGTGGGIAYNPDEFREMAFKGLQLSPAGEILVEESIIGWKEFELEVMRDTADNVVIICSIENFDPMGIHTGDSITVAPAMTLTDRDYQEMRDLAIRIIRKIGVETGGSNIQFAKDPISGKLAVIEMNPRVSRSSALASKATGFPIAKIAAKLAVGYRLDEIPNDITRKTPASFEPTLDYVIVKIPRFAFEKFPNTPPQLGIQMKSVGETMGIGRTFKEAFHKAVRGLETGRTGFVSRIKNRKRGEFADREELLHQTRDILNSAYYNRLFAIYDAFDLGLSDRDICQATKIDPWFIAQLREIFDLEGRVLAAGPEPERTLLLEAKQAGFSDARLGELFGWSVAEAYRRRMAAGITAAYKLVDTCSAEFEAVTPYYYSSFEEENEAIPGNRKKVMILGGGPNRIGQGIEFDYCCVHAAMAAHEEGYESIMVNSNPETVSTDYDTSDRLYFEPLTFEDVMNIYHNEKPEGVIVQMGGQTPLNLAVPLEQAGVCVIGTSPDCIDQAEDRKRFQELLAELGFRQPENGTATTREEARVIAERIGYPVIVRPSYVLGGRAMQIVHTEAELDAYMDSAIDASPERPILIDKFLQNAVEVDVDAVCDGVDVVIAGVMEQIESAGVHSGDSACTLPPVSLPERIITIMEEQTRAIALAMGVCGLINIQFAIKDGEVYFLEVNPRASRTVPFVSKATGIQWAKVATKVMLGRKLAEMGVKAFRPTHISIKEAVLPFNKFPQEDTVLAPEMKSTGEVMGIAESFGAAYAKAQWGASGRLPSGGCLFVSVKSVHKKAILPAVRSLLGLGFRVMATGGTHDFLAENGIASEMVYKVGEGRPDIVDRIKSGELDVIFNTPMDTQSRFDDKAIRREAVVRGIPCFTTVPGINACVEGIEALHHQAPSCRALQDYFPNRG